MNSKDRLMAAIHKEVPDRLPVTVHEWQPYHLKHTMGGMTDIEAFKTVGMDAAIVRYPFVFRESDQWKVTYTNSRRKDFQINHFEIQTPKGKLCYSQGYNEYTTWEMEPLIKSDEDIDLLRYRPLPYFDKNQFVKDYDELGNEGIVRTFLCGYQGGCWQEACNLYGIEKLILKTFEDPEWVHTFLEILLQEKLQFVEESIKGSKVDLVETGGGAGSNTVISPQIFHEFCLPYDTRIHEAIRACKIPIVYHTCGGMTKIEDMIIQNGCDASETLSPVEIGGDIKNEEDARKLCQVMKDKVSLIGGMDQIHILGDGTYQEIEREVEKLFDWYGKDGGFVLAACDHFFEAPVENLKAFAEAAKRCRY